MIAVEIKALRDRLGWTQERLARELGVSWITVQRWEKGKVMPSPLAAARIAALANANAPSG